MPGAVVCPHCGSHVVAGVAPDGGPLCPACNNTGVVAKGPAWAPSPGWAPAPAPAAGFQPVAGGPAPGAPWPVVLPNADRAVSALVLGILAVAIPYVGFILAFVALAHAKQAKAQIEASGGRLGGAGMANAGRILAIVSLVLYGVLLVVVLAAVVFVLVSNLAADGGQAIAFATDDDAVGGSLRVTRADDGLQWSDFELRGSASCDMPFGEVQSGDAIDCATDGTVEVWYLPDDERVFATTFD